MELTPVEEGERLFRRALESLAAGQTQSALAQLERALKLTDNPSWHSHLGYCIAKERGQVKKGADLCTAALELEPENQLHYLNLAKVHLIAGHKPQALEALRAGMAMGGSEETLALLVKLGNRKPPVLSFLHRNNGLNIFLGRTLARLGLR